MQTLRNNAWDGLPLGGLKARGAYQRPDLSPLIAVRAGVGKVLKRGNVGIYESTLHPGRTEEVAFLHSSDNRDPCSMAISTYATAPSTYIAAPRNIDYPPLRRSSRVRPQKRPISLTRCTAHLSHGNSHYLFKNVGSLEEIIPSELRGFTVARARDSRAISGVCVTALSKLHAITPPRGHLKIAGATSLLLVGAVSLARAERFHFDWHVGNSSRFC